MKQKEMKEVTDVWRIIMKEHVFVVLDGLIPWVEYTFMGCGILSNWKLV